VAHRRKGLTYGDPRIDSPPLLICYRLSSQIICSNLLSFYNLTLELIINPLPELGAELMQWVARMNKLKQFPREDFSVISENVHLDFMGIEWLLKSSNN
jgi:hypothetical protein